MPLRSDSEVKTASPRSDEITVSLGLILLKNDAHFIPSQGMIRFGKSDYYAEVIIIDQRVRLTSVLKINFDYL